jgi:predicted lipid-binding transport protein (Tim44 family)
MSEDSTESFAATTRPPANRRPAAAPAVPSHHELPNRAPTWRERHFATIMGAVLGGLLVFIMVFQAAC